MKALRDNRGFSVLDVVAGVAIAAIMLTMTAPALTKILSQYRLRGAASQVTFELARVRMQAIAQSRDVRIRFTGDEHYVVERSDDNGSFSNEVASVQLPTGVTVAAETTTFTFNREGMSDDDVVITLQNDNGQRTLSMNTIGRISES